jgi:ABC transporter transmembrane region
VAARAEACGSLMATVIFSIVVSLLMVTGPLYMLQVYDRVLGSRSEATLVALSVLVTFLFLVMGILEHARGRVMAIVGARFQDRLDRRVFVAAIQRSAVAPNDPLAIRAQRDLEAIRTFLASPVLLALMDVPWTPFFLAVIFVFHPMMGWLAVAGGVVLIVVTVLNQALSNAPQKEAGAVSTFSERMADQSRDAAGTGHDRGRIRPLAEGTANCACQGDCSVAGRRGVRVSDQDVPFVPAISDAGFGGLTCPARGADLGRDDCGVDPDGAGAVADRDDRRAMGGSAARVRSLAAVVRAFVPGARAAGADGTAASQGAAGGRSAERRSAGGPDRPAKGRELRAGTRAGAWGHWRLGRRKVHAGKGFDRGLATVGGENPAGWRNA